MAVLLDTGIIYAYYDRRDEWHERAAALIRAERGGLVVPSPVIPEVDHLLGHRLGAEARHAFYGGLVDCAYVVADLSHQGYSRVAELDQRYAGLDLGFVDCAVVAIAEELELLRIATTDRRDFGPLQAELSIELLP